MNNNPYLQHKGLALLPNLYEYATREYWNMEEACWVLRCGLFPMLVGRHRMAIRMLIAPIEQDFVYAWTVGEIVNKGSEDRPLFAPLDVLDWAHTYKGFEVPKELKVIVCNAVNVLHPATVKPKQRLNRTQTRVLDFIRENPDSSAKVIASRLSLLAKTVTDDIIPGIRGKGYPIQNDGSGYYVKDDAEAH